MPEYFHNPYHFVPLPENRSGPERQALEKDKLALPTHVTHERFAQNTFSGRIICRLTTVTPLVIGSTQSGDGPKQIEPFRVPGTSDPGIPGSALRGLISSVLEATTGSALRVLDCNRIFSYRKSMEQGLSALGLVVDTPKGLHLYPLAMQHRSIYAKTAAGLNFNNGESIPKGSGNYSKIFPCECPKVYFGTRVDICDARFHARYRSNSAPYGGPFYALPQNALVPKIKPPPGKGQNFKPGIYFDLGDMTNVLPEPWDDRKHNEPEYVRGILRVLGLTSVLREKSMPTKEHEFFIPFSKEEEDSLRNGTARLFPILPEALERFNQLADERTKEADDTTPDVDVLPFTPHGQTRAPAAGCDPNRPKRAYHLKAGDIVFFRPTADGTAVAEVSLSSIWRGRVEKGAERNRSAATVGDFVAKADPALLPMGDPRKTHLTPAELLFGFVEQNGKRALASRVRFSLARPLENQGQLLYDKWVDLQVLSSPKPPSANFYFHQRKNQRWIAKSSLNLDLDQIQGRKFYLHTHDIKNAKKPDDPRWRMHPRNVQSGDYDRMRVQVRPVLAGKTFEFEVRFDNLSRFELGALLHALRPSVEFHHKLGLGKPLGLGTVRIDPVTLELIDRYWRYAVDELTASRVHQLWERDPETGIWTGPKAESRNDPAHLVEDFLQELKKHDPNETALRALLTIGNPGKVTHRVHYPQVAGIACEAPEFEADRYEWWVTNDYRSTPDSDRQHIGHVTDSLPALKRLPKTSRGGTSEGSSRDRGRRR